MDYRVIKCPSCGASIPFDAANMTVCRYCGNTLVNAIPASPDSNTSQKIKYAFSLIETNEFYEAKCAFADILKTAPENESVLIGMMLTCAAENPAGFRNEVYFEKNQLYLLKKNLYYYKKLRQTVQEFSDLEKQYINSINCNTFLEAYSFFGDEKAIAYIISSFGENVSICFLEHVYLETILAEERYFALIKRYIDSAIPDQKKYEELFKYKIMGIDGGTYTSCIAAILSEKEKMYVVNYFISKGYSPEDLFMNFIMAVHNPSSHNSPYALQSYLPLSLFKRFIELNCEGISISFTDGNGRTSRQSLSQFLSTFYGFDCFDKPVTDGDEIVSQYRQLLTKTPDSKRSTSTISAPEKKKKKWGLF